jgi:hypothetical protein
VGLFEIAHALSQLLSGSGFAWREIIGVCQRPPRYYSPKPGHTDSNFTLWQHWSLGAFTFSHSLGYWPYGVVASAAGTLASPAVQPTTSTVGGGMTELLGKVVPGFFFLMVVVLYYISRRGGSDAEQI